MKKEFLKRLKEADVNEDDWFDVLLDTLPHGYEKGYLEAMSVEWNNKGFEFGESFKYEVEEWSEWFKWSE
jgi:hypothetical protein